MGGGGLGEGGRRSLGGDLGLLQVGLCLLKIEVVEVDLVRVVERFLRLQRFLPKLD